jgi:hypothetical protein
VEIEKTIKRYEITVKKKIPQVSDCVKNIISYVHKYTTRFPRLGCKSPNHRVFVIITVLLGDKYIKTTLSEKTRPL